MRTREKFKFSDLRQWATLAKLTQSAIDGVALPWRAIGPRPILPEKCTQSASQQKGSWNPAGVECAEIADEHPVSDDLFEKNRDTEGWKVHVANLKLVAYFCKKIFLDSESCRFLNTSANASTVRTIQSRPGPSHLSAADQSLKSRKRGSLTQFLKRFLITW